MSRNRNAAGNPGSQALVFSALGDQTRLTLITKLAEGEPHSISQLTKGSKLSRQAISKHLRILKRAGIVHSVRCGRESRFQFDPRPIEGISQYLDFVSEQWNQALFRLKSLVEG